MPDDLPKSESHLLVALYVGDRIENARLLGVTAAPYLVRQVRNELHWQRRILAALPWLPKFLAGGSSHE